MSGYMQTITFEEAQRFFEYQPETGVLTWRITFRGKIKAGEQVGTVRPDGRRSVSFIGKRYYAYRVAWLLMTGEWPKNEIDHFNGERDDNRWCNLRDVTPSVNQQNHHRGHKGASSKLLGVSWCSRRQAWRACITTNRKLKTIGFFSTEQEAHEAYIQQKAADHAESKIAREHRSHPRATDPNSPSSP